MRLSTLTEWNYPTYPEIEPTFSKVYVNLDMITSFRPAKQTTYAKVDALSGEQSHDVTALYFGYGDGCVYVTETADEVIRLCNGA